MSSQLFFREIKGYDLYNNSRKMQTTNGSHVQKVLTAILPITEKN